MQGAEEPSRLPRTVFTFNSDGDIQQFATGCDADMGGTSTVHFGLEESPETNASIGRKATGVFWGDMRLGVKADLEGKIRGGYAGFRNKVRVRVRTLQMFIHHSSANVKKFADRSQPPPYLFLLLDTPYIVRKSHGGYIEP